MIKSVYATERREYYLDCPYCSELLTTDPLTNTLSLDAVMNGTKTTCPVCNKTFRITEWG